MKNSYSFLILILLISAIHSLNAQNLSIGLTGDIGFNKISNVGNAIIDLDPSTGFNSTSIRQSNFKEENFVLSGNLGIFIEKDIGKKSSIILKCVWMQVKGKGSYSYSPSSLLTGGINGGLSNYEIAEQPFGMMGDTIQSNNISETSNELITSNRELRLSYIAIPIIYRYKLNKLGISGGIQTMFGFSARGIDSQKSSITNDIIKAEYKLNDFKKIDAGFKIGIDYQITPKIRITAAWYQGLEDTRNDDFGIPQEQRRNRQLSLGVEYVLKDLNKQEM